MIPSAQFRSLTALVMVFAVLAVYPVQRTAASIPSPTDATHLPQYWFAVLMVPPADYDKSTFRLNLLDFFDGCTNNVSSDRCVISEELKEDNKCRKDGNPMANCEVVSVSWNDDDQVLQLWVEGPPGHRGIIWEKECVGVPFKKCFAEHLRPMAMAIKNHDNDCHRGRMPCKLDNHRFIAQR